MSASIYFSNCVLFARFHFSRSLTLYGISFIFLENAGGRTKCPIALKKTRKLKTHFKGSNLLLTFFERPPCLHPTKRVVMSYLQIVI